MTVDLRTAVVTQANYCVAHKPLFPYLEHRPFQLYNPTPEHLLYCDCSETSIWCLWMAGAPEPFPGAYAGLGNTESFLTLPHVPTPLPGDFVVYGEGLALDVQHMAVIVEGGADPLTMSHGQSSEPAFVLVSHGCPAAAQDRITYVRCLPVTPPTPPPPPAPKELPVEFIAQGPASTASFLYDTQSKTRRGLSKSSTIADLEKVGIQNLGAQLDKAFLALFAAEPNFD